MLYVRNTTCGMCDQEVIYDSVKHTLSCGCKTTQLTQAMPRNILATHYHLKRDEKP